MKNILPLFPLQLVVFPGEDLNLHIFEPRYKQLIGECASERITFGIPAYLDGEVKEVGTEMELVEVVKKYPKGEMDIKTRGLGVFEIQEFFQQAPGKLYPGAMVQSLSHASEGDPVKSRHVINLVAELFELLKVDKKAPEDPESFRTFDLAHHVGFSLEQEYNFLCIAEEEDRQDFMLQHLEQLIPVVQKMEALREKVRMNGHFRNIIPPKL